MIIIGCDYHPGFQQACSQQLSRCNLTRMNQQPEIPPDERIEESYSFSKDKIGRELDVALHKGVTTVEQTYIHTVTADGDARMRLREAEITKAAAAQVKP
jgi:hypothetical protein